MIRRRNAIRIRRASWKPREINLYRRKVIVTLEGISLLEIRRRNSRKVQILLRRISRRKLCFVSRLMRWNMKIVLKIFYLNIRELIHRIIHLSLHRLMFYLLIIHITIKRIKLFRICSHLDLLWRRKRRRKMGKEAWRISLRMVLLRIVSDVKGIRWE